MATESVKFLINAKDNTQTATRKAEGGFKRLKSSALAVGAGALGALAITKALSGLTSGIRNTIAAFVEMEKVQVQLAASLELNGANAEKAVPSFNKWANGLQATINVSDETANSLAILAQQMGVSVGASQDATEAAIGLSAALPGLSQESALKGVANAMEGNFSTLERYLPALKSTNDQNEKMRILLDASNKGIKIQAASTETLGGSWEGFKNTIGDTMENIGSIVGPTLTKMVKGFQFVLKNWTDISRLIGLTVTLGFVSMGNDIKHQVTVVWPTWVRWFGDNFSQIIKNAMEAAEVLIKNFTTNASFLISSLAEFVTGGFNLEAFQADMVALAAKNATDIGAIMAKGLDELPEIADRELTAFEKVLIEDANRIKKNLQDEWDESFKIKIPPTVGEELSKLKIKTEIEKPDIDSLDIGKDLKADIGVNQAVESRILTGNQGLSVQEKTANAAEETAKEVKESKDLLSVIGKGIATLIDKTKPSLIVEAP